MYHSIYEAERERYVLVPIGEIHYYRYKNHSGIASDFARFRELGCLICVSTYFNKIIAHSFPIL